MSETDFPVGTPVCVKQTIVLRDGSFDTEIIGVVEAWEEQPTGSWHAHGKDDKLWLKRLKLKKADGEISLLNIDDHTRIAKLEAVPPGNG